MCYVIHIDRCFFISNLGYNNSIFVVFSCSLLYTIFPLTVIKGRAAKSSDMSID